MRGGDSRVAIVSVSFVSVPSSEGRTSDAGRPPRLAARSLRDCRRPRRARRHRAGGGGCGSPHHRLYATPLPLLLRATRGSEFDPRRLDSNDRPELGRPAYPERVIFGYVGLKFELWRPTVENWITRSRIGTRRMERAAPRLPRAASTRGNCPKRARCKASVNHAPPGLRRPPRRRCSDRTERRSAAGPWRGTRGWSSVIQTQPLAASQSTVGLPAAPWLPKKGDKVERTRNGVTFGGKIFYADELQVLVKWDNGSSSSLRVDRGELGEIRPLVRTPAGGSSTAGLGYADERT